MDNPPGAEDPRVRFAGERTLLAWVRTGLAMMAFGFVVARFGLFLQELAPIRPDTPMQSTGFSLAIGMILILLGSAVSIWAAWDHRHFLGRLNRGEPYQPPRWSLSTTVAAVLAVAGVIMAAYLVILRA
ncbi:MAG TPA: DUF202 domain-containing protein [Gemmataceae bacterium]|nr:DUF202 domain-containing protein [Gemmataceae bacterium]